MLQSHQTIPHLDQLLELGVLPGGGINHGAFLILLCQRQKGPE